MLETPRRRQLEFVNRDVKLESSVRCKGTLNTEDGNLSYKLVF